MTDYKKNLSIFDSCCMIGNWKLDYTQTPADAESLNKTLNYYGIGRAVVYNSKAVYGDLAAANVELLELLADRAEFVPCYVLMPDETKMASREILQRDNVRAVRFMPVEHKYEFRLWQMKDSLSRLQELRIPVWIDFSVESWTKDGTDFNGISEVCTAFPELPFVLVRPNINSYKTVVALMRKYPNLYVETSYMTVHRGIEFLCNDVDEDRVLFGSGLPLADPGAAVSALKYAMISREQMEKVAAKNLERLLAGAAL